MSSPNFSPWSSIQEVLWGPALASLFKFFYTPLWFQGDRSYMGPHNQFSHILV